jgi:LysR family glycine cleavage system transcriptional activator
MFKHLPSLNSLKAFEAAARLKSFKDAATELYVTPTAISHQIRNLETHIQKKLFERHTRSIKLTPAGRKLARIAHDSFQEISDTLNEFQKDDETLTIGTTNAFAAMWLVPNLQNFHHKHPKINIAIKADDRVVDIEKNQEADLLIRYGIYNPENTLETLIIKEKIALFATKQYLFELPQKHPVFYTTRWKNANLPELNIEAFLKTAFPDLKKINLLYYEDENQVIQAALSEQGIAVMSELLVSSFTNYGNLVQYPSPYNTDLSGLDYYTLIAKRNQQCPKTQAFKEWLIEQIHSSQIHRKKS